MKIVDKDTVKSFLKPEWRKIIIFLIFFFMGYILLIIEGIFFTDPNSDVGGGRTPEFLGVITQIFLPLGLGLLYYLDELGLMEIQAGFLRTFITLVVIFLYYFFWYIISCLIIWTYDKFRKK